MPLGRVRPAGGEDEVTTSLRPECRLGFFTEPRAQWAFLSADVAEPSVLPVSRGTLHTTFVGVGLGFGGGGPEAVVVVVVAVVAVVGGGGACAVVLDDGGCGSATTVHVFVAGVGSISPWGLIARTANVWVPAATGNDAGLAQGANAAPSS